MRFWILTAALLANSAFASTIVSSTYKFGFSSTSSAEDGIQAVSWTQTGTYTDVTIGAGLAADNGLSEATGTAYLMTEIGPGTTAGLPEEIASGPVTVSGNPGLNNMTTVFSSLSLGPGTYYLVIDPSSVNLADSLVWDAAGMPFQVLASGVSGVAGFAGASTSASFPPANTFTTEDETPIFSVTGTLSKAPVTATPEPSATILLACGIAGLVVARKIAVRRALGL
jgi:hypothetical protein